MFDWFCELGTTDKVQVVSTIMTSIGVISGIVFAIFTLKQNNEFKRESSRAVISIYLEHFSKTQNSYLILENFGNSIGMIEKIETVPKTNVVKSLIGKELNDFKFFTDETKFILAPKQKISAAVNCINNDSEEFDFIITYYSLRRKYVESYHIKPNIVHTVTQFIKSESSDKTQTEKHLYAIKQELKEITEKL
ncbi:MAG: hypothetical protein PHF21_00140 [Bacilli bacterium]|nr:hypothetical protein [Bacilli bacterium]